ncbi:hypothetical protein N7495_007344 [Penicillium taxi]|uniref:uncharacterized protein n=1 Tax=Penicillium taxi TaxID=168475 RepID=UPI002545A97E|nr:uncharacterized protein N7495_007344 [Penicillium taxi]KAJ5895653.1 hypothetical protein N7495_007344 [Penicillium taxi]
MVRSRLTTHGHCLELVPAIMCLTLVELMFPSSSLAMTVHITAVGEVLRSYGPKRFQTGTLHELFNGFRPLLVLEAVRRRRPTFLALESWIEIPSSQNSPTPMQALLTEVVSIPSLLYKSDVLFQDPLIVNIGDANEIAHAIIESLHRLCLYEKRLWLESDTPCYWTDGPETPLRFPTITMANCLSHIWAFRIICLAELEKFSRSFPYSIEKSTETSDIQTQIAQLSKLISLSMEYLLGDDMKLYGPASTLFPLSVAYQALGSAQDRGLVMEHIDRTIFRLVEKGLRSAPFFVKCDEIQNFLSQPI